MNQSKERVIIVIIMQIIFVCCLGKRKVQFRDLLTKVSEDKKCMMMQLKLTLI